MYDNDGNIRPISDFVESALGDFANLIRLHVPVALRALAQASLGSPLVEAHPDATCGGPHPPRQASLAGLFQATKRTTVQRLGCRQGCHRRKKIQPASRLGPTPQAPVKRTMHLLQAQNGRW